MQWPPLHEAAGTSATAEPAAADSIEALAALLGVSLTNAASGQDEDGRPTKALTQLLDLVRQKDALPPAAAAAYQQEPQQQQEPQPQQQQQQQLEQQPQQQQAWQQPAPQEQDGLLASLVQALQRQQQRQQQRQRQQQQQQPLPLPAWPAQEQQPQLQPYEHQPQLPQAHDQQGGEYASLFLGRAPQLAQAPGQQAAAPSPPQLPPQEGSSQPRRRRGAQRQVRVTCNEVPGTLHLDSLYVACECLQCEARVRLGHDRPIFGLSRWEKHCGSKAKKWRISLRVVPGSCPEVSAYDGPMAVGTWLDMQGIGVTGSGERIGSDGEAPFYGPAAKRARLPSWTDDDWGAGASEQAGGCEAAAVAATEGVEAYAPWELPLLDSPAQGSSVSDAFLRQQRLVFAEVRRSGGSSAAQHSAIFGLVAALLEGPAQHLLPEVYLPWLNDLSAEHLARQASSFGCYLDLLEAGMEGRAVHRQLLAFMRGTLRRILASRQQAGGAADEGEGGTATEEDADTTAARGVAQAAGQAGRDAEAAAAAGGSGGGTAGATEHAAAAFEQQAEPAAAWELATADGAGAGEPAGASAAAECGAPSGSASGEQRVASEEPVLRQPRGLQIKLGFDSFASGNQRLRHARPCSRAQPLAGAPPGMGRKREQPTVRRTDSVGGVGGEAGAAAATPASDLAYARTDCGLCKQPMETDAEEHIAGVCTRCNKVPLHMSFATEYLQKALQAEQKGGAGHSSKSLMSMLLVAPKWHSLRRCAV